MTSLTKILLPLLPLLGLLTGCASGTRTPIPTVPQVDLPRFMGDWYVIADIPARPERNAYNEVESYAPRPDGRVQTTLRFREGGFDGEIKTMHPVGTVLPQTGNARWNMQFIWPFQAEYVIAYLDPDYRSTIIGRSKRDYVWIMARTPQLTAAQYDNLVSEVRKLGYDTSLLRKVPQQWPEATR